MLDQTTYIGFLHWKYWVRVQDAQVINAQGYSNHHSRVDADRYGITVTNSSWSANRVFVQTADGQNFFDANNNAFAATAGNMLRLVYVGADKEHGALKAAYNMDNRSFVEFDNWNRVLPKVAAFIGLGVLCLLAAFFMDAVAAGPLRGNANFDSIRGIAPWLQSIFVWCFLGLIVFSIYRFIIRTYFYIRLKSAGH